MSKTTFIVNGVDVLEENAKLKKENEILQTSLEMIKNTEGQAHIICMKLTKKLEKIKEIASKYSQREDYLLGGLFTDLVDELSEVLKDEY